MISFFIMNLKNNQIYSDFFNDIARRASHESGFLGRCYRPKNLCKSYSRKGDKK